MMMATYREFIATEEMMHLRFERIEVVASSSSSGSSGSV
jgi:hypothetical protein